MEIAAKTTSMFMLFLLIFVAGGIFLQIFFQTGGQVAGAGPAGFVVPLFSGDGAQRRGLQWRYPLGADSGVPDFGKHPHGAFAGHLFRLQGEASQAERAGQNADQRLVNAKKSGAGLLHRSFYVSLMPCRPAPRRRPGTGRRLPCCHCGRSGRRAPWRQPPRRRSWPWRASASP